MSYDAGCSICQGCLPDGEWCHACGFNEPVESPAEKPETDLERAIRQGKGDYTGTEVVQMIQAFNRGKQRAKEEGL